MPLAQQCNQVEPAYSRHFLIDDKAAAGCQLAGAQELGSGGVAMDLEALDLEREFERIANGRIVVDDENHNPRSPRTVFCIHDVRRAPAGLLIDCGPESTRRRAAALIWLKQAGRTGRAAAGYGAFGPPDPRMPAISAMRTRSDRLDACILVMRLAR